jgi:hypothetical protein
MKRHFTLLDWGVLLMTCLLLIFSIIITIMGKQCRPLLQDHFIPMSCAAVFVCALLASWMFAGGSESELWSWMPPYCFFPKVKWLRWTVVLAMIIGTFIGVAKSYRLLFL